MLSPDTEARPRPSRVRTLVSGTSLQALAQIVQLAINLVLTPFVIRGLGHDRFSIFLLISTVTVVMGTFDGGIGPAALRYFTLYAGSNDRESLTRLLNTLLRIVTLTTVVVFPALIVAAPWILRFFSVGSQFWGESLFLFRSLTVLVGLLLARNLFNSVLFAHHKFAVTATASIGSYVVYAGGLVLTVQNHWGLYGIAYTFFAQQLLATVVTVPAALRYTVRGAWHHTRQGVLREFFHYAWKVQVSSAVQLVSAQKDQLVAARMLTAHNSGPYAQGSNFAQQLRQFPLNALSPMQAMVGNDVGRDGARAAREHTERLQASWVVLIAGWSAVGIPAIYFGVRAWLPASYGTAGTVAAILLVGQFFTLSCAVLLLWVLSLGHPELELRFSLVGLALNIALSIPLGLRFGVIGVVVATSLSQALSVMFLSYDARRVLSQPLRWFVRDIPVLPTLVAATMTTALEFAGRTTVPTGALGMISCGVLALPGVLAFILLSVPIRTLVHLFRTKVRTRD